MLNFIPGYTGNLHLNVEKYQSIICLRYPVYNLLRISIGDIIFPLRTNVMM